MPSDTQTYFRGLFVLLFVLAFGAFFFSRTYSPVAPEASFGGVSLTLDYATTNATREKGLGGRTNIPGNYGMLFVFPKNDFYGFCMKDTLVDLDMFWLDAQGKVVFMAQEVATSSYPTVFYPTVPARYVLETQAGFAQAHGVATGTPLLLKNFPTVTE